MTVPTIRFFHRSEFACKCGCGKNHFRPETMIKADRARGYAGVPFVITSGYRCPLHNAKIGSKSDVHPLGYALDVKATDSRTRALVVLGAMKAGFTRIGIDPEFVHLDDDPSKAPEVMWLYKKGG